MDRLNEDSTCQVFSIKQDYDQFIDLSKIDALELANDAEVSFEDDDDQGLRKLRSVRSRILDNSKFVRQINIKTTIRHAVPQAQLELMIIQFFKNL